MVTSRLPSVLVVDDEPDLCQNLADILQEFGYEVETALCGETAIEMIRDRSYDVALLDLKMPGMDGLALSRSIRIEQPCIVPLILTAFTSPQIDEEAMLAGVRQVLCKPVDLSQLLSLVHDAVQQPALIIVDDDVDLCKNLQDILRYQGYRVSIAHSDHEALLRLDQRLFQVVLVDLILASGDGRIVLEAIRKRCPETKAILMTGHPNELAISMQTFPVPDAVCLKPIDMRDLLATLHRYTDH